MSKSKSNPIEPTNEPTKSESESESESEARPQPQSRWVELEIGTSICIDGRPQDDLRPVRFMAEELGSIERLTDYRGHRGERQTLYQVWTGKGEPERYVVYVEEWSHWQGEPNFMRLLPATRADLDAGGVFERLGRVCGLARPLTLDEALSLETPEADEGEADGGAA